ncbi:MAG TPA: hypothetical protein VGB40_09610, partial [Rubrobacteraceae bacterium]
MFSARKRTLGEKPGRTPWPKTRRRLFSGLKGGLKPHVGMRVWLTAMFVLVTAFAAVAAYEIVRPKLEDTLNRASETRFEEVAEQFEDLLRRDNEPDV